MLRWLLLLPLFLAFSSCARYPIEVRSELLNEDFLASSHCYTPDLCRPGGYIGERLVILWRVPECYLRRYRPHIELTLRFRNRELQHEQIPMGKRSGHAIFSLTGYDYLQSEGILTYKAEIVSSDGVVLDSWHHHVWVEYITLQEEDEEESFEDDQVGVPAEVGEG